jgi:hypothetical protein
MNLRKRRARSVEADLLTTTGKAKAGNNGYHKLLV